MANVLSISASGFLNALGVQTHVPYTDGGYANIDAVAADLAYLGVSHVRDGISDGQNGSAPLASFIALAREGVTFTIGVVDASVTDSASLAARIALVRRLVAAVPGSVTAIEGANEINNWPVTFNGVGGLQGAIDLQRAIYQSVKSDPALAGVAVDYFTGYNAGSIGAGPNPATTPGLADFDNQHPYPLNGAAPAGALNPASALGNQSDGAGPFVYTETGYSTYGPGSVSPDVQAKYTLDLVFDAVADGAAQVDLYQLMDAYAPGSRQGDDGYGLFAPGNAAKPAATALHNLVALLAGGGASATAPAYTISGLPASGRSLAITKANGAVDIAIWAEPAIWNARTQTESAAAATSASLQLGAVYSSVAVYDPLAGTTALQTFSNVSQINVSVSDHPVIVELGSVAPANHATAQPALFGADITNAQSLAGGAYALDHALLGRAPDPLTLETAIAALQGGGSAVAVAQALLGAGALAGLSDAQFLSALYRNAMNRAPDASGLGYYENALAGGASRAEVAVDVALSPEALADAQPALSAGVFATDPGDAAVARLYWGLFDRAPDAAGLAWWEARIAAGDSLTDVAQSILGSAEYQSAHGGASDAQFLNALYADALGRAPDAGGLAYWTSQLAAGVSRVSVAVGFIEGAEGQEHLAGNVEIGMKLA